tara:strand:- start:503 stop:610 length:108 start_codon:yes stop_codon:yes gene_type:complete
MKSRSPFRADDPTVLTLVGAQERIPELLGEGIFHI